MPRITPIPAWRLKRVFEKAGFQCVRTEGDHHVYTKKGIIRPIKSFALLLKFGKSSFLRKQESSPFKTFWIPAYAGMTKWGYFSKLSNYSSRMAGGAGFHNKK